MNYRQIISIIVCIVMLFSFCACQAKTSKDDTPCWMPFGLKFGMTYGQFSKQLEEYGIDTLELKPASSNAGFLTDGGISLDITDSTVWAFLDSPTMKKLAEEEIDILDESGLGSADTAYTFSGPKMYFSFNQDQELYEFYCFWTSFSDSFPSSVLPEIIDNYNNKLGVTGKTSEYSGQWDSDEHKISITYSEEDSRMILVHHCITYNLDS